MKLIPVCRIKMMERHPKNKLSSVKMLGICFINEAAGLLYESIENYEMKSNA
jgi:hypothetical protein